MEVKPAEYHDPITYEEWEAEGIRLFGEDKKQWKFICPVCGYVQSVQDYLDVGADKRAIAFSCIGCFKNNKKEAFDGKKKGPCNYTGGGLFKFNPVNVEGCCYFDFAREDNAKD